METKINLKGCCYVLHQGYYHDILKHKYDMILYPEKSLTQFELRCGIKYEKSIITESVQLISCYDSEDVFVWIKDDEEDEGQWENPQYQTYGTSYELLESRLLFFNHSIPINIISTDSATKLKEKLDNLYK